MFKNRTIPGRIRFVLFMAGTILVFAAPGQAQNPPELSQQLVNGNMEESSGEESVEGWFMVSPTGGRLHMESEQPREGKLSACLDSRQADSGQKQAFTNLMQVISAQAWRGKRLRLRAQVRTGELEENAAAQLWMRVDLPAKDNSPQIGAFDNMQDRPMRSGEWAAFEIVLNIDPAAEKIALGMFLAGRGRAWLDEVTLQEVSSETPLTGAASGLSADSNQVDDDKAAAARAARPPMDPRVLKAFAEAENAPPQAFWTSWLILPAFAFLLFALSACPIRVEAPGGGEVLRSSSAWEATVKFAFRFSFAYWLLYSLPAAVGQFIPYWGFRIAAFFQDMVSKSVSWTAAHIFSIESELVPPNGSGDTTFNYINVFLVFCLALAISTLWSLIDWRQTDYRYLKDLLRSYLRYVLGMTLLGYGLAKVAWTMNQFPTLEEMGAYQLDKTWGDSSPMNVLWSFMGASRAYTVFGGLGEVLGGVLLIFRRTTTLGAIISAGVMLNVMMLNFCYDVPVKLYSTHLFVMALYILLPNLHQFVNLFVWHRPTEPLELLPPYTNRKTIWVHRALKLALIVMVFAIPIWHHSKRQIEYLAERGQNQRMVESQNSDQDSAEIATSQPKAKILARGFRWINEVPYNR